MLLTCTDFFEVSLLLSFYLSKIRKIVKHGKINQKAPLQIIFFFVSNPRDLKLCLEVCYTFERASVYLEFWVWFLILRTTPLTIEIYRRLKIGFWFQHFLKVLSKSKTTLFSYFCTFIYSRIFPAFLQTCFPNLHQS